jgi:PTH1 family peptidyl-tRNA hydrolase
MKLVVGLGNPGRKYEGTRHNIGFEAIYALARKFATAKPRTDFQAEVVDAAIGAERLLLVCPQTFMNLSGTSVVRARDFYKLENSELMVLCDDFNLPLGKLRIRAGGSAGGQKGLQDIIRCLGTEEFPRLRIGIGAPPDNWEGRDFVLSKFTKEEQTESQIAVHRAVDAVECWATSGIAASMNQFNALK